MEALQRYPKSQRRAIAQKWGKLGNEAQQRLRDERGPDADTMHKRAQFDSKGQLVREGCTFKAGKVITWRVVRSVAGRVDQFDVTANEKLKDTCGRRKLCSKYKLYGL